MLKGYGGLSFRDTPTTGSFATILLFKWPFVNCQDKCIFIDSISYNLCFWEDKVKKIYLTRGWIEVDSWLEIDLVWSRVWLVQAATLYLITSYHALKFTITSVCGKSCQVSQSFK